MIWMVDLFQQLFRRHTVLISYGLITLFVFLLAINSTVYPALTYFCIIYPRNFGLEISVRSFLTTVSGLGLLSVIIAAYLKAMHTSPGSPRTHYPDVSGDATQLAGSFCHKCEYFKPSNAHHCSVCKVCVMDMDHHCRTG
jgi:palmitoyltransferase